MSIILGVNAYHSDSSACILIDGVAVAAIEEERLRRVKHWAGFPSESIRFCLKDTGVGPEDIENEPIVCSPDEAIDCFLRTKMDVLVLGNYFVTASAPEELATTAS